MDPTSERSPALPRALGFTDLVLLKLAVIVNVNTVPAVAVYGRSVLALWLLAWAAFFVPSAVAVLVFARRYPGEGGIYLWTRRQFGELHGFLAGWCYCTTNLFYIPMQLVYLTGLLAFVGGPATSSLVNDRGVVATIALGWLAIVTVTNLRGLRAGKWIQNLGGVSTAVTIGLLGGAAIFVRGAGAAPHAPWLAGSRFELLSAFSVMCFSFIGIELASTMGNLVPFVYLFAGLMIADGVSPAARTAGAVGILTSAGGIAAAFVPPGDVQSRIMFEVKMLVGCVAPTLAGLLLFVRSRGRAR